MQEYIKSASCTFRESKGKWGILSNFYPLVIFFSWIHFMNTEYLYQLFRYSHRKDLQEVLLVMNNTLFMKRKAKGKAFMAYNHPEFENNKLEIMEWLVRLNPESAIENLLHP